MTSRTGRAAPLPPEERRASIISATVPLLHRHGRAVTSRQIAEAAGIAEGTIFRVFADKDSLVDAAVASIFDPSSTIAEIEGIDPAAPLPDRVAAVVEVLSHRLERVWGVLALMADVAAASMRNRIAAPRTAPMTEFLPQLARLLEPDSAELGVSCEVAARMLRAMIFGSVHPILSGGDPLTTDQIVTMFLHGVLHRQSRGDA